MIEQFRIQNNLLNIIRFNNKINKEILNEEKDSLVLKEKDSSYGKQRFLSYISQKNKSLYKMPNLQFCLLFFAFSLILCDHTQYDGSNLYHYPIHQTKITMLMR
jgi:hypothetical protein